MNRELWAKAVSGDPLVAAEAAVGQSLRSGGTPEARRVAVDSLLQTRDPLVVGGTEIPLLAQVMSSTKSGELWFESVRYGLDQPKVQAELLLAARLASCMDNKPCTLDDDMQLGCINGDGCAESREKYIEAVASQSDLDYQSVARFANRMRLQIDAGNGSAFLPPTK